MKTLTFIKSSSFLVASFALTGACLAAPSTANANAAAPTQVASSNSVMVADASGVTTSRAQVRARAIHQPTPAEVERYDVNTIEKMDLSKNAGNGQ